MQSFTPTPPSSHEYAREIINSDEFMRKIIHKAYEAPTQPALEKKMDEDAARMKRRGYTLVHSFPKIGRNEPCPCGSGKKFKKCHLNIAA
jgi:uncharacterized protein YecA (UPF0149 family)